MHLVCTLNGLIGVKQSGVQRRVDGDIRRLALPAEGFRSDQSSRLKGIFLKKYGQTGIN